MDRSIKTTVSGEGRVLTLSDSCIELGIALDHGIRICHVSCPGERNLFYEQKDTSDGLVTAEGWRVYGGHRLWAAPESEKSYYPDNDPISYEILENGVRLTQKVDPWLQIEKSITLTLENGGARLEHSIKNVSGREMTIGSWGVSTFAGGEAEMFFGGGTPGALNPERSLSVWGTSDLSRVRFAQNKIYAKHAPHMGTFKIGFFSPEGRAALCAFGQKLTLTFGAEKDGVYPDGGCNFELYMDAHVMELEALGKMTVLQPGECACHWEEWRCEKAETVLS